MERISKPKPRRKQRPPDSGEQELPGTLEDLPERVKQAEDIVAEIARVLAEQERG